MLIRKLSELPNLRAAKSIAFDLETCDPTLGELGPGVRRDAEVLGIAIGTEDAQSWYIPLGHEIGPKVDAAKAWKWVDGVFTQNPTRPVLGAALDYDLDYATHNGVTMPENCRDLLMAGRLLNLQGKYPNLNEVLTEHVPESGGKTGDDLWAWLAVTRGKGAPTRKDQIGYLKMAPADLVGEYAEGDVAWLARALDAMKPKLEARSAWEWYQVECEVQPALIEMRSRGVRVDVGRAEQLKEQWGDEYAVLLEEFGGAVYPDLWDKLTPVEKLDLLNTNSSATLARAYETRGVTVPKTALGNDSITKIWLTDQNDPFSKMIRRLRLLSKLNGTFVEGHILKHAVNGRIHPTIKQLWPRTLRTSSENPNEQNIPKRDEELAPIIRGMFLPEEEEDWGRLDYNQQEYRIAVHFAVGKGAEEARAAYRDDPSTNFHKLVHSWLPMVPSYTAVKNANFAKTYRAGRQRFAETLGVSREEGDKIFDLYDRELPFISQTAQLAERTASKVRGDNEHYLNILLKDMRMYFDHWCVDDWDLKKHMGKKDFRTFSTEEEAQVYGNDLRDRLIADGTLEPTNKKPKVKRADLYKAFNRVIQPSAAQLTKNALRKMRRSGVWRVLGAALVMVHDEFGMSVPRTKEGRQAFAEAEQIMIESDEGQMKVPLAVGAEVGPSWGELKEIEMGKWVNELGRPKTKLKPINKLKPKLKVRK